MSQESGRYRESTGRGSPLRAILLAMALAFASVGLLAGCEDPGPAEEAGEAIDEAAEDAGEAMDEAADEVRDELEDDDG